MTAKEALTDLLRKLSEQEAAVWLTRLARASEAVGVDSAAPDWHQPTATDRARLLALIDEWLADESGLDETVGRELQATLHESTGTRFREAADW